MTAIACDEKTSIILNDVSQNTAYQFPLPITTIFFFPLKQTLEFVFKTLQASAKTTVVNLQNSLFVFMTFHIALLLNKERKSSTTMSRGSCYAKEVMEWVLDEVVINTSYNHVVTCSNKTQNIYEIIFILYEYIYVYISLFKLPSPL